MRGRHPLDCAEGEAAEHAASFIRKACEQVLFEHGSDMDTVMVVKRLTGEEAEEEKECSV